MDELALLREQLLLERDHRSAVRTAARAALAAKYDPAELVAFAHHTMEYLVWSGSRGVEQDQHRLRVLRNRLPDSAATEHALLDAHQASLAEPARASAQLKAAGDPLSGLREFLALPEPAHASGKPLPDPSLERHLRIEDWRELAIIDADTILEERERFERVRESLPAGVTLGTGVSTEG